MEKYLVGNKFIFLFIFLFSFGLYFNSIFNGYSFDDNLITDNFKTKKSISDILTSFSYINKSKNISFAYRPVVIFSFLIDNMISENNPHVSHFINILIYAITCVLVFYFLNLMFPSVSKFILLLTTVIFIIHPVHAEAVNNIKSRDELLVGFFGFLMLIQYLKFLNKRKIFYIFLLVIFSILGVLSKKSFFVYPAIMVVIYFLHEKKISWKQITFLLIFLTFLFFSIRLFKSFFVTTHFIRHYEYFENPLYLLSFWDRLAAGPFIFLYYLKIVLLPWHLKFYYGYDVVPIYSWKDFLPYIGIAVAIIMLFMVIRFWKKNPFLSFGLIIILINGAAVSNILSSLPGIIAERFFFFGILGYGIILSYIFFKILEYDKHKQKNRLGIKLGIFILSILLLMYTYLTFKRNKEWYSMETLIESDIPHLKNSAKANETAASVYFSKFKTSHNVNFLILAKKHYLQCIKIYPKYAAAWNNLGFIYEYFRDSIEAEKSFLKAYKYSGNSVVIFNLARFYQLQNKQEKAKQFYKEAIRTNPDIPNLIPFLKIFIMKENMIDEFIPYLKNLIQGNDNYTLRLLLIDLYNQKKDYNNMILLFDETYKKYPTKQLKQYKKELEQIFDSQ